MRVVSSVAGNVMTSNVINKNDATECELNFELVSYEAMLEQRLSCCC